MLFAELQSEADGTYQRIYGNAVKSEYINKYQDVYAQYVQFTDYSDVSIYIKWEITWLGWKPVLNVFYGTLEDWDLYATGSKRPEKENEEINNKKEVATMHCIYERPMRDGKLNNDNGNTVGKYYCNNLNCHHIPYEDNVKILQELYKKNNECDLPVYTQQNWAINTPWHKRLEEMFPVV